MHSILLNGFPKCGIHALEKAVRLLGVIPHISHTEYFSRTNKSILIKRNPKDVVISSLRWNKCIVDRDSIIKHINMFYHSFSSYNRKENIVVSMGRYEGWLHCNNTLVVSYETLLNDITDISCFLKISNPQDISALVSGNTLTYNEVKSNHLDYWDDKIDNAWYNIGGNELCARWGY